ncbi:conserved domain protein [Verrucomicrobiia bacterium DG1235]|nr:conserved domain protein [Verrucomicrobiae bacterium DG1235]
MQRGERKLNKAAGAIAQGDFSSNRIVELANAETMYGANAKVIQAQDEMLGSLLDVKS